MFEAFSCVFNPVGCINTAISGISLEFWVYGAFLLGLVVGAITRWAGVATALFFVAFKIFGKNKAADEPERLDLPGSREWPKDDRPTRRKFLLPSLFKRSK